MKSLMILLAISPRLIVIYVLLGLVALLILTGLVVILIRAIKNARSSQNPNGFQRFLNRCAEFLTPQRLILLGILIFIIVLLALVFAEAFSGFYGTALYWLTLSFLFLSGIFLIFAFTRDPGDNNQVSLPYFWRTFFGFVFLVAALILFLIGITRDPAPSPNDKSVPTVSQPAPTKDPNIIIIIDDNKAPDVGNKNPTVTMPTNTDRKYFTFVAYKDHWTTLQIPAGYSLDMGVIYSQDEYWVKTCSGDSILTKPGTKNRLGSLQDFLEVRGNLKDAKMEAILKKVQ